MDFLVFYITLLKFEAFHQTSSTGRRLEVELDDVVIVSSMMSYSVEDKC